MAEDHLWTIWLYINLMIRRHWPHLQPRHVRLQKPHWPAEEQLRRVQGAIDNALYGVAMSGLDGKITSITSTSAYLRFLGYSGVKDNIRNNLIWLGEIFRIFRDRPGSSLCFLIEEPLDVINQGMLSAPH